MFDNHILIFAVIQWIERLPGTQRIAGSKAGDVWFCTTPIKVYLRTCSIKFVDPEYTKIRLSLEKVTCKYLITFSINSVQNIGWFSK